MRDTEAPIVQQGTQFSATPCADCGHPRVTGEIIALTADGAGRVGTWSICMCTERMICDRHPAVPLPFGWLTFARHLAVHDA